MAPRVGPQAKAAGVQDKYMLAVHVNHSTVEKVGGGNLYFKYFSIQDPMWLGTEAFKGGLILGLST